MNNSHDVSSFQEYFINKSNNKSGFLDSTNNTGSSLYSQAICVYHFLPVC
jgi:hypothetical protein